MVRTDERRGWRFACLILSSLVFVGIAVAVVLGATDDLDATVRNRINSFASPPLTSLAFALSFLGSMVVVGAFALLTAVGLWYIGEHRSALLLLAVYASAVIVNNAVKFTFARPRPEVFFGTLPESFSFASGHALFSACIYGVAVGVLAGSLQRTWLRALMWIGAVLLIGGIGLSRVYLGVHYLTDVIAGFALAALIVCAVRGLFVADART